MIQQDRIFENFFDDPKIIPTRLSAFGDDTLNRITSANTGGDYTALITLLTAPLAALAAELGDVDVALAVQKGTTLTNDQQLEAFGKTMSSEEPFIARALGGKGSAVYLQFYPKGISEYTLANKTNMATLTNRVNIAATANAAALGPALTSTLQAFEKAWKSSRDEQQQQKGTLGNNRVDRSDARANAEIALLTVVHSIAAKFPGNVEQCKSFFNFNLLFAQTRRKHQTYANPLAPGQIAVILNRTFTDTTSLTIRNTDDNAPFAIWLAATEKEAVPPTALIIQPGNTADVKPSDLGNLTNTFLLVKNTSEVNEGSYEVVVV
jgi:hypothetical protein